MPPPNLISTLNTQDMTPSATPHEPTPFYSSGQLLGGGLSGIAELLPDGHVLKSPWPSEVNSTSQRDLQNEAKAYKRIADRLGSHPRLLTLIAFDPIRTRLTLEYMPNGTLRDFLAHHAVSRDQRTAWCRALAEGLAQLHALDILHCDLTLHNVFLDEALQLKIGDLASCVIDGSNRTAEAATGFYPLHLSPSRQVTTDIDLFALGSCLYEILTGEPPYHDLPSPQAETLIMLRQYPDVTGLTYANVIRDCWLLQAGSASSAHQRLVDGSTRCPP